MRQRGPDALRDAEVKLVQKVKTHINKGFKQSQEHVKPFYFFSGLFKKPVVMLMMALSGRGMEMFESSEAEEAVKGR